MQISAYKYKPLVNGSGFRFFRLLFSLCMVIMLGGFAGCSEDNVPDSGHYPGSDGSFTQVSLPGYISIQINTGLATRDEGKFDFDDGDDNEFALAPGNHHYVVVYNNSGVAIAVLELTNEPAGKNSEDNITLTAKDAYVSSEFSEEEDLSTKDKFIEFLQKYAKEAYALINVKLSKIKDLNPSSKEGLKNLSKTDLTKAKISDYSIEVDGKEYFTMTSSVFVEDNVVKYGYEFDINAANIYNTKEDALNGNPTIKCYVERIAAKHTVDTSVFASKTADEGDSEAPSVLFSINTGSLVKVYDKYCDGGLSIGEESYVIPSNERGWEVQVWGFGLNALETDSYFFKNISTTSYFEMKGVHSLKEPYTWRSYWAEDEHYTVTDDDADNYPDQFRQSLEKTNVARSLHEATDYEDEKDDSDNPPYFDDGEINVSSIKSSAYLKYLSFNDFTGKTGPFYTLENTYDDQDEVLGERGYFSAGTHLILVGQIKINDVPTGSDLYYDQNSIFYTSEDDLLANKLDILNRIVLKEGNHGIRVLDVNWLGHSSAQQDPSIDGLTKLEWVKDAVLWVKVDNNWKEAEASDLRLIPAEIAGGDGARLIAPKSEITEISLAPAITDSQGNRAMDESASSVTKLNANNLISLFHKIIGPVEHFKSGYVYYAAPILHNSLNGSFDYTKLGDIGVVRNNWYNIRITGIKGVGRAVDDPNQPIIPVQELKRSYLNITVTIADWHKISQELDSSWL